MAPSDEQVNYVISLLGLDQGDRALIAAALQAKNGSVEQVVNEFFDDPARFGQQYSWDDNAFSADRDGTTQNQPPSFAVYPPPLDHNYPPLGGNSNPVIQGVDPGYYTSTGAPSRPPSRTNNRSPLGKLVNYTADHTAGATVPTSSEQEDADLQRAIAESVAASGVQSPQPPPQESGVTEADTSLPYFGPANRSGYDQNEWAMVTLNREPQEPSPLHRMRAPGVPAFLRCRSERSWDNHQLGAIITILHSIPAARNALLRSGKSADTYGSGPEWWKGKPILRPAVRAAQEAGEMNWGDDAKPVWAEELHRLMAFLDGTDRNYGTADMLAGAEPEGSMSSGDCEKDFFDHLRVEVGDEESPLMATADIVKVVGDGPTTSNEWGLLEPNFSKEQLLTAVDLYSIWDMIFFMDPTSGPDIELARMAVITHPSEVMCIRFRADDGLPSRLSIPEVFYVDRYLAAHKEELSKLQQDMSIVANGALQAQRAEQALTNFVSPDTGAPVDSVALCRDAVAEVKVKLAQLKVTARWRKHEEDRANGIDEDFFYVNQDEDSDTDGFEYNADEARCKRAFEDMLKQVKRKQAEVEGRLEKIRARKANCEQVFRKLSSRFTVPSEEEKWNPTHKYTLRGLSNSHDVFYVCIRAEPDLMEVEGADDAPVSRDQWWKLGYVEKDAEPVKTEMTTFEKAVEDTCGVGSRPILIYATEKAMEEDRVPLADALRNFVRFDNRLFKQEVKEDSPREKKRGAFASPASPAKRRNRSSSVDSMATNRASIGDMDDDDMRDAPFEFDEPFLGDSGDMGTATEMQELVDTSVTAENTAENQYVSAVELDDVEFPPLPNLHPEPKGASATNPSSQDGIIDTTGPPPALPMRPRGSNEEERSKSPEMQERGGVASPFFGLSANGKAVGGSGGGGGGGGGPASLSMELEEQPESQ